MGTFFTMPSPTNHPLPENISMHGKLYSASILVTLLTALSADAEIIKGVMAIRGAEMS